MFGENYLGLGAFQDAFTDYVDEEPCYIEEMLEEGSITPDEAAFLRGEQKAR